MFKCKCSREFKTNQGFKHHENRCKTTSEMIDEIKKLYKEGKSIRSLIKLGFQRYTIKALIKETKSETKREKINSFNIIGKWICNKCLKEFEKLQSYNGHRSHCGKKNDTRGEWGKWNKGKTKETDQRIAIISRKVSKALKGKKRIPLSNEHKLSISKSQIKAHEEGRAYYIGKLGKPSYPEKVFDEIIKTEFNDKNYEKEYHILSYYLDFAWPLKKKYIEVDGEQHYKNNNHFKDRIRDKKLLNVGWKVLRIRWIKFLDNKKYWINKAKKFIDFSSLT
jgi:very-short-patch-repair endonuclease